jgi:DtxR family Mn-dependent transcriptional regulator
MNISGASVTGMLKRLASMKLVDYNSYKGVRLTNEGRKIALEIIRHHRLLELYLREALGFPLEKIHDEACRLEHVVSKDFLQKIEEILGNPEYDPHGHPIPSKDGDIEISNEKPLVNFRNGDVVIVKRLSDHDPQMLSYFEKKRILPSTIIRIVDKAPLMVQLQYFLMEKVRL